MKTVEESEVPAEKGDSAPDREAEVPQAAAAADRPEVEADREDRKAKDAIGTQKKDEKSGPTSPSIPVSHAPKHTDDDGDLRDTAMILEVTSAQESCGGGRKYVNTPYPGEAPHFQESRSYLASAKPAEYKLHRRYIAQHVLAREAGEPFMYAVIQNKAITRERRRVEESS